MLRTNRTRLATALILALLLTITIAPAIVAQNPPPPSGPTDTPTPAATPSPPSPGPTVVPPPPDGAGTPTAVPTPPGNGNAGNGGGGGTSAPAWPPPGLIVTHAATQVQLAPVNDGLQSYLIGSDGTGHSGPFIPSFAALAQQHAGVATLWTGANPGTGKSVTIYYLPAENRIRISTYYPDTQYDVNKPYVFTVDAGHNVVHEQW